MIFPDHFTAKHSEFGYQVKQKAGCRNGMKSLLEIVLKPLLEHDNYFHEEFFLPSSHIKHKIYKFDQNKTMEAIVRRCARFFQVFYPTEQDLEHFAKAVDDIRAQPVNNSNKSNN